VEQKDIYDDYTQHVLSFIEPGRVQPYKIVLDPGNGMGGYVASRIFEHLPCRIIPMNFEPDGSFPNHEPNPMLEENQGPIIERVLQEKADLGVMWDGDADRCFLVDASGHFVEGYFITALLAEAVLRKKPGSTIICDPRNTWAVVDTVRDNGGRLVINKAGHSFFKEAMRRENAAFAGEMSGHYYFRENYSADSGMIPVLMILELMSDKEKSLLDLLEPLRSRYFISGEINTEVEDAQVILRNLQERYSDGDVSLLDGLSVEYDDWRFNVRPSNTEPLLRLNVEARSRELMERHRDELLAQIRGEA
jgi:phosphomannomutase